jgi:hypothetical protein
MTCLMETSLGAYVLDGLEPDESEALRLHLTGCTSCQDVVVDLAWIPSLLRTVPLSEVLRLDDAPDPRPTPMLLDRVLESMTVERHTRRRRRRRGLLLAAAAALLVALAGGVAAMVAHDNEVPSAGPVVRSVDPRTRVGAEVTMTARGEGTGLQLKLTGVDPGERCSLVARARDGRTETAATWVATYTGTADVPGTTAIAVNQLSELDVVTVDGRLLVRLAVPPPR